MKLGIGKIELIITLIIFALIECCVYVNIKKELKMNDIGSRRVSHLYSKNGIKEGKSYSVETVEQAIEIINREADKQVNDDSIDWNVFTFEVLGPNGWENFEDDQDEIG